MSGLGDALGYVAGSLEKPGRAVRGLLYGRPREGLAALPFSDTLGITDPGERVSGRQLTDKFGLTNPHDQGWGSWGLGMGAEMATDPTALIGESLLGKAGVAGLSRAMKPSMVNPVHRLSRALGDVSAAGRMHVASPLESALWNRQNREGALKIIRPADYLSMMKDEGNPIGRFHALADKAQVPVFPGASLASEMGERGSRTGLDSADVFHGQIKAAMNVPDNVMPYAVWSNDHQALIPNVVDHPALWSDLGDMTREMERTYGIGHFSTANPQHIGLHEIGHALHKNPMRDWEKMSSLGAPGLGLMRKLRDEVSDYGIRNPREFVAEAFAKRANVAAQLGTPYAGFPRGDVGEIQPWLSMDPHTIYGRLGGPKPPPDMIKKLTEYMGDTRPGGIGLRRVHFGKDVGGDINGLGGALD